MPLFYFHLRTPDGLDRDEEGLDIPSLERAYLDACRTIPGLSAEFLEDGRNPLDCAFVIAGADGATLMEVPFHERLRRPFRSAPANRPGEPNLSSQVIDSVTRVRRGQRLAAQMHALVADMMVETERLRATMHESHRLLGISRAGARP